MFKYEVTQTIDLSNSKKLNDEICEIYDNYVVLKNSNRKEIEKNSGKKSRIINCYKYTLINLEETKTLETYYPTNPFSFYNNRFLLNDLKQNVTIMYDGNFKEIYRCGKIIPFGNGLFTIYNYKDIYKKGLIDKDGNIKLKSKYYKIYDYNKDYYVVALKYFNITKWYLYNKNTNKKRKLKNIKLFEKIDEDRFIYINSNNKTILIDDNFSILKEFKSELHPNNFSNYRNGLGIISPVNENDIVIDKDGNIVLKDIGQVIDILSNEILLNDAEKSLFYIYDHKGNKIKEFTNTCFEKQINSLIQLEKDEQSFIINKEGTVVSDSDYEVVKNIGDKYLLRSYETNRYKIIDELGNDIIPEIDQKLVIGEETLGIYNALVNYGDIKINYNLSIELDDKVIYKSFDTIEQRNQYKNLFEDIFKSEINECNQNDEVFKLKNEELFSSNDKVIYKKLIKNRVS